MTTAEKDRAALASKKRVELAAQRVQTSVLKLARAAADCTRNAQTGVVLFASIMHEELGPEPDGELRGLVAEYMAAVQEQR